MNLRYSILCFLVLGCACTVAMRDNGLILISALALFIWTVMLAYWRVPNRG